MFSERLSFLKCSSNVVCVFIVRHLRKIFCGFPHKYYNGEHLTISYYEKIGYTVTCIDNEIPLDLPEGWGLCRLSSLLIFIKNGATIKQFQNARGYPITRIESIATGEINRSKFGYANIIDVSPYEQYLLKENDILMSHINSPKHLCKCAIYKGFDDEKIIHGMNLLNIRFISSKMAEFMMIYFKSNIFKTYVNGNMKHSVNQASITTTALSNFLVPFPSEGYQSSIVNRVNELFEIIDSIKKSLS